MNTSSFLPAALVAATAALAAPTVTNVSVDQSDSQTVRISYTLDEAAVVTLDILTNATGDAWASIGTDKIKTLWGDVGVLVQPGTHTIYWAPEKDWIEDHQRTYDVKAAVKAWAVTAPPDYMVVDLRFDELRAGAPKIRYFETAEQIPDGVTDIKYKTDFLVMRKIHAKGMTYRMGSPSGEIGAPDTAGSIDTWDLAKERTYHITLTNDFYLGIYELTRKQAITWLGYGNQSAVSGHEAYPAGGNNDNGFIHWHSLRGSTYQWPGDGHQVPENCALGELRKKTGIDFDLPLEAQWEFACRAGTQTALYTGENLSAPGTSANLDAIAWYKGNSGNAPHEVGLKQPNAFGLYDMLGNVSEYCLDRRKDGVYPFNGAASQALIEPGWQDTTNSKRGLRGGHYKQNAQFCRAAAGYAYSDISTSNSSGAMIGEWGFRLWAPAIAK